MSESPSRPSRKLRIWAAGWMLVIGCLSFGALALVVAQGWDRDAIHAAVRRGDVERVKALLDRNPSLLEQRSRLGLTPIQKAAWDGHAEVLRELIRRGGDVNALWDSARSRDGGWNALHITAIQGRTEAADVLIRAGTDLNRKSVMGETPLAVAERNSNRELAALFRANGGGSGN